MHSLLVQNQRTHHQDTRFSHCYPLKRLRDECPYKLTDKFNKMIPYRGGNFFTSLPPVIKNLVIIYALMLLITFFTGNFMYEKFSLFYFESEFFRPYQFVTHMFMHGNFIHLFFNMYSLIIFGVVLEHVWGSQKFFLYYMVTGLGAAILHSLVLYIDYSSQVAAFEAGNQYALQNMQDLLMTPTVGASGAVYGVLLAYGMLF